MCHKEEQEDHQLPVFQNAIKNTPFHSKVFGHQRFSRPVFDMSNFSIDALLGNQSRKVDAASLATKGRTERDQDHGQYERINVRANGVAVVEDYEELSSDSDVFSEKDYETAKCKHLILFNFF